MARRRHTHRPFGRLGLPRLDRYWPNVDSRTARRFATVAALVAATGWLIVDLGGGGPPGDPSGARADAQLSAADTPEALERLWRDAVARLERSPADVSAIFILGGVAERRGEHERARRLMELAGTRDFQHWPVQAWLINAQNEEGAFKEALDRADALLRSYPQARARVLPMLLADTVDPRAFGDVRAVLEGSPPWRGWFLGELGRQAPDLAAKMLAELRAGPAPPTAAELESYVGELVRRGDWAKAYFAWVRDLPADVSSNLGPPFNGGFERPLSGVPFDWRIDRVPGASTEIAADPDGGGRALLVTFLGQRVAYRHIGQLLLLGPGRYRLAGRIRSVALDNAVGLEWRLACAERPNETLAQTKPFRGTVPWTPFEFRFDVPSEACRAQWLRLEIATRIVLDQIISGRIWFDDLRIAREAAG